MKRLVLIDGSSYLYRAFHALPPLTNAHGEPTGALFGVVNMLRATLKEKPDYVAFVVDAPGKTFRDDLYPEYKANRPPMPDDLRVQVQPMCDVVEALGIDILRVEGVEADDVIGTLAVAGAQAGLDVTVSTSDKDFVQLVRPGISLVNTMSGSRMDSDEAVREKYGVPPDRIIDLLALMGDAVDNVPGVEKCGPKTAAKWLGLYGSLDGVIENAGGIKGKVGDNLRAALGRLPLNRELVTIRTDVPLDRGPDGLPLREPDTDALRALYTRYGFTQALRDLGAGDGAEVAAPVADTPGSVRGTEAGYARPAAKPVEGGLDPALAAPGVHETILDRARLDEWIAILAKADEFAFDTETDALDPLRANLVGMSFAVEPGRAAYLPLGHDYGDVPTQLARQEALEALRPLLEDPGKRKIGHHGKYDLHVMRRHGIEVRGYAEDTMLESFVYNATASRHDMDSLAMRYLGYTCIKYSDVAGKGAKAIPFSQVAIDAATPYACEDADITLRLHRGQLRRQLAVPALEKVYREIEMPLVPVLARIEAHGVRIDGEELRRQSADLSRRMLAAQQKATELAGRTFNLDSPKQLQALLFDELGLPALVKTPKGQPSTNEEALEAIADRHELPRVILEHRGLAKLRSTYTDKLPDMINPDTGRLHTSFHQAGAATGRLASSDPNLQNIPIRTEDGRRIRRAFIADEGNKLIACDYSQIELRIMAHLSGDEGLLGAFAAGADIHAATAAEVFGRKLEEVTSNERRAAKAINFGLMYGMGAWGLARNLGIDRGEAQDYIGLYFSRYPGVREYMDRTREQAREQGYVETVFGRRLDEVTTNERRAAKAINFGLMYGMGAWGLARNLGIDRGEAQDYIGLYFSRYPGVRDYMDRTREQAREQGYVETVFGRRLYLDNISARNQGLRAGAERAAINAPMQGTAADIIKRAMIDIDAWLAGQGGRARMILQVHDELVFEAEAGFVDTLLAEVVPRMTGAAALRVPLMVESGTGDNWDEAH